MMRALAASARRQDPVDEPTDARRCGTWVRRGDLWSVAFGGCEATVRHSKGMGDLACLLAVPGSEIPVLDLAADAAGRTSERGVPLLDERARRQYRDRLRDLRADIDAADAANDSARAARARHEHEWLVRELSGAFGLGGRERSVGDATERARKAVTMRLRDALARLCAVHPPLARHLRHSIVTGRLCSYRPEHPVAWTVEPIGRTQGTIR